MLNPNHKDNLKGEPKDRLISSTSSESMKDQVLNAVSTGVLSTTLLYNALTGNKAEQLHDAPKTTPYGTFKL